MEFSPTKPPNEWAQTKFLTVGSLSRDSAVLTV